MTEFDQIAENDTKTETNQLEDSETRVIDKEDKTKETVQQQHNEMTTHVIHIEEKSKVESNNRQCGYISSTVFYLFMFFIVIIVFPLTGIIIIVVDDFHASVKSMIASFLLIAEYMTVIISLGYILTKTNQFNLRGENASSSIGDSLSIANVGNRYFDIVKANLMIYTFLAILGIGDAVFDLAIAADEIINIINKNYKDNLEFTHRIIVIVEEFLKAVYHLNILLFIIYHKDYKKIIVNSLKVKYFIILLSLSSLLQWIFIIFKELHHDSVIAAAAAESNSDASTTESYYNTNMTIKASTSISNSSNLIDLHRYEAFLFPLGIEFRIACFIELLLIAMTMSQKPMSKKKKKNELMLLFKRIEDFFIMLIDKAYSFLSFLVNKIPVKNVNVVKKFRSLMVEQFIAFNMTTLTIIVICVAIVIVLFQDVNIKSSQIMIFEINEICELLIIGLTLVYTIFLFFSILRRSKLKSEADMHIHATHVNLEKKIDFLILNIANLSLVVFCTLSAAGAINSFWFTQSEETYTNQTFEYDYTTGEYSDEFIPNHVKYITIVASFLPCIQSSLQVLIAWLCANKVNANRNYLKVLIIFNFTLWIFETFSSTKYQKNQIQRMTYGETKWQILSAVFIPLSIFYRFHSCLMLIKIKAHKYLVD